MTQTSQGKKACGPPLVSMRSGGDPVDKMAVKANDNKAFKVIVLDTHKKEQPSTQKEDASYFDIPAFIDN